jgi:hypothetical protein
MLPRKKVAEAPGPGSKIPPTSELIELFQSASRAMLGLPEARRPRASTGLPGSLIELDAGLPCLILPDLHARPGVLRALMETVPPLDGGRGAAVRQALEENRLQVVMLGDGPHTEGRPGAERWRLAYAEYLSGWKSDAAMREEMGLAFRAMELVARLLVEFPESFFFLKGNHDNIMNREGGGDHGFGKFAEEGAMAFEWTRTVMGEDFLEAYDSFEKALPLMARGGGFLACHAEPAFPMTVEDAIEARSRPEVVEGLTWTDNDAAVEGSVEGTLRAFLPENARPGIVFGGHRPVRERFILRAQGRYVQIHDVSRMQAAWVRPGFAFDPLGDIIDLGQEQE